MIRRIMTWLRGPRDEMRLCPFHAERTPSLCVRGDHYFCFGCQRRGLTRDLPPR